MLSSISGALVLIISKLGGLYVAVVLLRFLLQTARADFYNPLCQAVVKLTSPLLNPLRRIIPSWRRLDIASLVLALLLSTVATAVMGLMLTGGLLPIGKMISWAVVGLINLSLTIYWYAIIIMVVASFIAPFSGHPALLLIYQLLQPYYQLAHRILPPMGGLDFSPMLLMAAIWVAQTALGPLATGLRVPLPIGIANIPVSVVIGM